MGERSKIGVCVCVCVWGGGAGREGKSTKNTWQNLFLHFHVCCFSINRYEWIKFFYGMFILWVSNQKKYFWYWSKALLNFFTFFALNSKHWKSQSSVGNRKLEANSVNVFCQKGCSWKWMSIKLPAAIDCNCNYYGLKFITWKYNTMNKSRLWS